MNGKWSLNKSMRNLLDRISDESLNEVISVNTTNLIKLFHPPLKKVRDCIIMTDESPEQLEESYDLVMEDLYQQDPINYELYNNEVRINTFFEEDISKAVGVRVALLVIDCWIPQLKMLDPDAQFCFLIYAVDDYVGDHVEIRFHKMREEKVDWIQGNEEATEAIGCLIV